MAKYQQYEEYKDSGVEWLGLQPIGWRISRVKFNCSVKGRIGFRGYTVNDLVDKNDGALVIGAAEIVGDLNLKLEQTQYISWKKYYESPEIMLEEDMVLFVQRGSVGKVALIPPQLGKATINPSLVVLRDISLSLYPKFLSYSLLSSRIQNIVRMQTSSTAIPMISQEQIGNYYLPIPSYREQKIISSFLDHETAQIDTLIDRQQSLIQLLKEKRQAVISHAVTKGLNPDAPMKDSGVEWLGEVPEHWEVLRLKHLIHSLESGCSVNAADTPAQENEIGVLKTSCVYTRTFRVEENKTVFKEDLDRVKCPIRKGAIIISRMNTPDLVGASAIIDVDAENIFLPDRLWQTNFNDKFDLIPEFLAYFMTIEGFRNQISLAAEGASSSMQSISKEDYLSISCILPSIKEQQEIVKNIEEIQSKFNDLVNNAEQAIQLMQERRTALISAAVTGKIDVRGWVAPE